MNEEPRPLAELLTSLEGPDELAVTPSLAELKTMVAGRMTRTFRWFLVKVALPSVVILCFYPLYYFILKEHDAFANAFSHGDFLLLALVLLLEIALEHHYMRTRTHLSRLETLRIVALLGGIIFTLAYAWSKFDLIALLPAASRVEQHERLLMYAKINCYAVLIAVVLGLSAYYTACVIDDLDAERRAVE